MASRFKRKRRLEIEYIESVRRYCFIIDFKGESIDRDDVALCYLRVCKDVVAFHLGSGGYERVPSRNTNSEREQARRPYYVCTTDRGGQPTVTQLLRLEEEIHSCTERFYDAYNALQRGARPSVMDFRFQLR